ncbi:peptide-methionine (S)-S-oxide reductase MsrA [Psychrobium sp. 1_MG-2023]|uniref:peptide-methionine (S)-S-oxide reductase MsrA n=1 Tax=Psychrobium sp. 1_MG-2023 TaxID=3062624 RepID=UPI000C3324FB|nr:peptide-methionine (S)-S-oxide reductase MsrA [Psychrobium sp. 1_MG-2023]MDP2560602.1 peptide-methionine (S)-S-oxide reductase MsrA [Psychrobium sp. 1_MG-2023]PKF57588.1 peptide-methionine (S)-S-oxide reductase [Alteromonadales bacterium alter-6D02]
MELATFGGGCFWGVEALFRQQDGVIDAVSGYEGGETDNPTYQQVCTGTTGHAEVVQVTFDPQKISYQQLLAVFFDNHNPTELNRQGVDVGTQYRSAVFFHDQVQQQDALAFIQQLSQSTRFADKTIVTEVTPATTFFKAEEYHQDYLAKNGLGSCHI